MYDDQIATDAFAYTGGSEIAGQFTIQVTARPGGDVAKVEQAIDEELNKFLESGPTTEEIDRVKTRYVAGFLRGIERIGGFGGKSDVLARRRGAGKPDAYKETLGNVQRATAPEVKTAANRWLSDGVFVLEVHPFPNYKPGGATVDRAKLPEPGAPPSLKLPKMQRATLSSGLKVVLAERHEIPVVNFVLAVDSGYASDQFGTPGTARLAMGVMDEGTAKRNAIQIGEETERLGAQLNTYADLDSAFVRLSALETNLDASLDLFSDVVRNPAFPERDFRREQKLLQAAIQREKVQPFQMALRVIPGLIYGKGHAYGNPLTGSGTEASVGSITRDALVKFHQTWFKPNNATLVVVGDTTLQEITPKLEKVFEGWKSGDVPKKNLATVQHQPKQTVYVVDKPGSIQSIIIAGHVGPPKKNPDEIAIETMNTLLGGMFISRLNMNLREDKHWSYGAPAPP